MGNDADLLFRHALSVAPITPADKGFLGLPLTPFCFRIYCPYVHLQMMAEERHVSWPFGLGSAVSRGCPLLSSSHTSFLCLGDSFPGSLLLPVKYEPCIRLDAGLLRIKKRLQIQLGQEGKQISLAENGALRNPIPIQGRGYVHELPILLDCLLPSRRKAFQQRLQIPPERNGIYRPQFFIQVWLIRKVIQQVDCFS